MKVWTWKDAVKADLLKNLKNYRQKGAQAVSLPLLLEGAASKHNFVQKVKPCLDELITDGIIGQTEDNGLEGFYLIAGNGATIKKNIIHALTQNKIMTKAKIVNRKRILQKCLDSEIEAVLSSLINDGQVLCIESSHLGTKKYSLNPKYKGDATNE